MISSLRSKDTVDPQQDTEGILLPPTLVGFMYKDFPHVDLAKIDGDSVMNDTIHDCLSHDTAARTRMPFRLHVLGVENGRMQIITGLEDLQQVFDLHLRRNL